MKHDFVLPDYFTMIEFLAIDFNKVTIATNVISEKYIDNFDNLNTYVVRIPLIYLKEAK